MYPKATNLALHPLQGSRNPKIPQYGLEDWIRPAPYLSVLYDFFKLYLRRELSEPLRLDAQFFLYLICEFWLDTAAIVRRDFHLITGSKQGK